MSLILSSINLAYGVFPKDYPAIFSTDLEAKRQLNLSLEKDFMKNGVVVLELRGKNASNKVFAINSLMTAEFKLSNFFLKEILENGWQQCSYAGYRKEIIPTKRRRILSPYEQNPCSLREDYGYVEDSLISEWFTQLVGDDISLVIGAVTIANQFSQIFVRQSADGLEIRVICQLDGLLVRPGEEFRSEKIALVLGQKEESLKYFTELIRKYNKVRLPQIPVRGLCCAYYYQGNKVDQFYVDDQLEAIERMRPKFQIDYLQIDCGYCCIGDWLEVADKFPSGLEHLVEVIKKRKMKAGVWVAPFIASPKSRLFNLHPGWFLKDSGGNYLKGSFAPIDNPFYYPFRVLDITNPEVEKHLNFVFNRLSRSGFDLFKIDFLYPIALVPEIYHGLFTRAQVLRKGLELIRKAVGEKGHLLTGVTPLSPLVGLVDSVRVGGDTPFLFTPIINDHILRVNLRNCLARQFLNGRIWINDADCLVCRPNTGLSEKSLEKHLVFIKNYGGSIWFGDNFGEKSPAKRVPRNLIPV